MTSFHRGSFDIQIRLFEKPPHHDDAGTECKNDDTERSYIDKPLVFMDLLHVKSHAVNDESDDQSQAWRSWQPFCTERTPGTPRAISMAEAISP